MEVPSPPALLQRIAELPAGGPLVERLREIPGVYLVGGAVRDLLLGGHPVDLDLVVEGDVEPAARQLGGARVVHDRFGTMTVTTEGHSYDLARARSETYASPGALPDVEPADLGQDLQRRDFTVNAIAVALGGIQAGMVIALPTTVEDLDRRLLRVLHDASFRDDPTRLLRLVRYQSRLGFAVEPGTAGLAEQALRQGALGTVSRPRVGNELRFLSREPDPVAGLQCARALALDSAIHPGWGLDDPELARRGIGLLPAGWRPDLLALATASRGVEEAELAELLDALAFEAADRDVIVAAATRADSVAARLSAARRPSEIAEAAADVPLELVALAGAIGPDEQAEEWLERLRHVRLEIDGSALIDAGIPEGPAVGRGLQAALRAKLDGRAGARDDELAVALEAARGSG